MTPGFKNADWETVTLKFQQSGPVEWAKALALVQHNQMV